MLLRWFDLQNRSSAASTLPPSSSPPLHLRCGHTRRRWAAGWWAETAAVPQDSDLDPAPGRLPSRCRWRRLADFPPESPLNRDFLWGGEENRKWERGGRNRTKSEIKEEIVGEDKGVKIRFYISHEIHCHLSYHSILLVTFSFFPQTPLGEGKTASRFTNSPNASYQTVWRWISRLDNATQSILNYGSGPKMSSCHVQAGRRMTRMLRSPSSEGVYNYSVTLKR